MATSGVVLVLHGRPSDESLFALFFFLFSHTACVSEVLFDSDAGAGDSEESGPVTVGRNPPASDGKTGHVEEKRSGSGEYPASLRFVGCMIIVMSE